MSKSTEIAVQQTAIQAVAELTSFINSGMGFYTSMPQETDEQAVELFNASSNGGIRIKEMINKPFDVENVIMEVVEMLDEKTGEIKPQARTILVSPDGTTYGCMSRGVFNSILRIMRMERFGPAPWTPALRFEAYMTAAKGGDVLSVRLLGRAK